LYVNDLADACIFLIKNYNNSEIINIGTGKDISIKELAETIKNIIEYKEKIIWDNSKPDGTPKKLLDVSKIKNLGWEHKTKLKQGIKIPELKRAKLLDLVLSASSHKKSR